MSKYHRFLLLTIGLLIVAAWIVGGGHQYVVSGPRWEIHKGLDLAGGVRVVLQADAKSLMADGKTLEPAKVAEKMDIAVKIIKDRVAGIAGVAEPNVSKEGTDRVLVELPGVKDEAGAIDLIQQTASLQIYYLKDVQTERNPSLRWRMMTGPDKNGKDSIYFEDVVNHKTIKTDTPAGMDLFLKEVVNGDAPLLKGEDLKSNAAASLDMGRSVIHFELNPHGTDVFRQFTTEHIGELTAIVIGGRIVTAPRVENPITDGSGQITGFDSLEEAQQKAMLLNSGALPVTLHIVQNEKIEATLGKEVVSKALFAGLIGLLVVLLFMLIVYRLPGLLADVALAIYAVLTLAAFMAFGVTMTLPGLAAFILSIGMAVDANILIFERLKEELRSGKTLHAAIDAGFSRAFTAIFDSNMCTIITALILLKLGTGMVQSFAFTLVIGVLISMFTAITVTRTFLHLVMNMQWAQKPSLFGLGTSWFVKKGFNIVGRRNYYFALSALVIVPGVIFYFMNMANPEIGSGLKRGIEFKPGTTMSLNFQQATITYKFAKPVEAKPNDIFKVVRAADTYGTEIPNTVKVEGNTVTIDAPIGKDDMAQMQNPGEKGPKLIEQVEKKISDALSAYGPEQPTVEFSGPKADVTSTDVQKVVTDTVHVKNSAQISKDKGVWAFVRTDKLADLQHDPQRIADALQAKYGMARYTSNSISPTISDELTRNAILAVILAAIVIVFYLAFRFAIGGFVDGLKYGVTAITATFHDVLVITGLFAILGHFLGWEIDTLFITAVLTMIGFSTHDTIVVFDRIRENLKHRQRGEDFEALANRSILQTFTRSINTSFTVLLTIIALTVFGGGEASLRQMYIALLVGIISGTYSSIFNATPLLVVWEKIASRGKSVSAKKVIDDRTMVAKEMKPVAQAKAETRRSDEEVTTPSGTDAERVKVQPKRKKRRY